MAGLLCYLWWFLAGLLLGWLLHWLLGRGIQKRLDSSVSKATTVNGQGTAPTASRGEYDAGFAAGLASAQAKSGHSLAAASLSPALAALAMSARGKDGRDDLQIVEGIGPKINELLSIGGIDTFEKLANAPVQAVQKILDDAGPRFRLANPASWAQQASLAAKGQWAELQTLQDALTAGVEKASAYETTKDE